MIILPGASQQQTVTGWNLLNVPVYKSMSAQKRNEQSRNAKKKKSEFALWKQTGQHCYFSLPFSVSFVVREEWFSRELLHMQTVPVRWHVFQWLQRFIAQTAHSRSVPLGYNLEAKEPPLVAMSRWALLPPLGLISYCERLEAKLSLRELL